MKVIIFDDQYVFGKNNKRLTGTQELPDNEAQSLIDNNYAKAFKEEAKPEESPSKKNKIEEIKAWLDDKKVEYDQNASKDDLLKLVDGLIK